MPRNSVRALVLGAVTVASLLAVAEAQQTRLAETSDPRGGAPIELTPEADTWYEVDVGTGAPVNPTPQGASDRLQAGWSVVGIDEYALLRFALPTDLPGEQVARAELVLHIKAASIFPYGPLLPVSGTLSLSFSHVLNAWDESTLSSLTPPRIARVWGVRAEKAWRPCHGEDCGDAVADVTPLVRDWLDGEAENNGLALAVSGTLGEQPVMGVVCAAASRESDWPPILRIARVGDEDVTPGPTTATPETPTPRPPSPLWLPLAIRCPPSPIAPTLQPTPVATSTPATTPGTGRYLLVERWTDAEYGPGCPGMAIDFPTYWFNASTGVLRVWGALGNARLEPEDVGYYASGIEATGRWTGIGSGLSRIVSLPAAFDDDRASIAGVDDSGEVVLTYAGEELELAAGGSRQWRTVDSWREPQCVVTNTVRITNFGYQDRAKIEYY